MNIVLFILGDFSASEFRVDVSEHFFPIDICVTVHHWYSNTGLFEMIVGALTTCHTQYTSDSSM